MRYLDEMATAVMPVAGYCARDKVFSAVLRFPDDPERIHRVLLSLAGLVQSPERTIEELRAPPLCG